MLRLRTGPVATGAYLPQIRRILQFAIVVATMIVIRRHHASFSFERRGDLPSRQTITGSKTTDDDGYSTRTMEATFPLVMVLKSEKKGPVGHFDLMENRDGRYDESKCETWIGSGGFMCDIEWDEWMLANAFIHPGDVVVEFGARFGTTSCILSRNVGKHGEVISVEPDFTVHGQLLRNRQSHGCDFHAVLGTVSSEPIYMATAVGRYGYAQRTSATGEGHALPSISTDEIETILGRKINVALIDCEGCIPQIDKTSLLDESKGVDLILMEEDQIKYGEWHKILYQRNLDPEARGSNPAGGDFFDSD
ncbi:hypothetical protein THAOC_00297, partial [Thalassiosira oceanica]